MRKSMFGLFLAGFTALAISGATGAVAQETNRVITKIADDLYRFQNKFHFSVFLVTSEGVIVTDPINSDAAKWLKAEIAKRFNKPIKYLIYSHDHRDHSSGGEVFADTAIVVGHENTKAAMIGEKRPTAVPQVTFSDQMVIELGGQKVELTYVGRGHSDNSIVMRFPAQRTLFAVDFVSVNRVPFKTLNDSYFPDMINSLRKVESMDFDILAPGHGSMGKKPDVAAHREYVEDLYNGVLAGTRAGKTLDQLKAELTLEKYKSWGQYSAWRPMNIEGVYLRVQAHRRGN